jgi:hypothetical protein
MSRVVTAVALAVCVAAIAVAGWQAYSPTEQAVYRTIAQHVADQNIRVKAVALSYPSTCQETREHIPELPDDLIVEFLRVNAEGARPLRLRAIEDTVPTVAWDLNRQFFQNPESLLGRVGEGGLLALSRVGISKDGNRALLCVQSLSHRFSKGSLFYYEKEKSGWALRNIIDVWIT